MTHRAMSFETVGCTNRSTYITPGARASNGRVLLSSSTRTEPDCPKARRGRGSVVTGKGGVEFVRGLKHATPPDTRKGRNAVHCRAVGPHDERVVGNVIEDRCARRRELGFHQRRNGTVELYEVIEGLVPRDRVVLERRRHRWHRRERIEAEIIHDDEFHVVWHGFRQSDPWL